MVHQSSPAGRQGASLAVGVEGTLKAPRVIAMPWQMADGCGHVGLGLIGFDGFMMVSYFFCCDWKMMKNVVLIFCLKK